MTVQELIKALQQMSQDATVVFHDTWESNDTELNNVQEDEGIVQLF